MQLEIATDGVPEHERFANWREAVFNTLAISAKPLADAHAPFQARFAARRRGPLMNCRFDSDGFYAERQQREIAHRQWHGYRVYRESSQGVWFRVGRTEIVTKPGDIMIVDADMPLEARPAGRYSDESWLLPKALLDPHLPAQGRPGVLRLSGRSGVEALAAAYLASLTHTWDSISEADMGVAADTLARLIGVSCGVAAAEQPDAVRAGRLVEAKQHIDRNLADRDLSPSSVAAALGISVRALHLLFEPSGSSFARHVQRRRLEQCHAALLAEPARSVTDIAFAWGFGNLSTFYTAFRAAFGVAPGDLRAHHPCGPLA